MNSRKFIISILIFTFFLFGFINCYRLKKQIHKDKFFREEIHRLHLFSNNHVFSKNACYIYGISLITGIGMILTIPSIANSVDLVPEITSKVNLDFSIARGKPQKVVVGLFGNEAPTSSRFFLNICKGDNSNGLTYDGSQVSTLIKDKKIEINKFSLGSNLKQETYKNEVGTVRIRSIDLASSAIYNDENNLSHDEAGLVSMKRGGGSFGLTINTKPNPDLDDDYIVIGKVLSGLETLDEINNIPVSKEDALGTKNGFSNLAKNGGDSRGKIASVNRPLKKIIINQCTISESASLASFMKF